jgi:hypothetical protein
LDKHVPEPVNLFAGIKLFPRLVLRILHPVTLLKSGFPVTRRESPLNLALMQPGTSLAERGYWWSPLRALDFPANANNVFD